MKVVKRTRYIADCGKGFWNKNTCVYHESVCKCWKNPKHKTCLTCKFACKVKGDEFEPQHMECTNSKVSSFTPAHENAPDIAINCFGWENKKIKH